MDRPEERGLKLCRRRQCSARSSAAFDGSPRGEGIETRMRTAPPSTSEKFDGSPRGEGIETRGVSRGYPATSGCSPPWSARSSMDRPEERGLKLVALGDLFWCPDCPSSMDRPEERGLKLLPVLRDLALEVAFDGSPRGEGIETRRACSRPAAPGCVRWIAPRRGD